ncbi:DUF7010 family protein [Agaribacter marinus]|uniref:Uncharacterized protein n=1 Tax=Agaribacter marinus TaxID=1431249 RepID=A0AA37T5A3_9ALTE|nr:hypothetical protein [Agaribacter marinus]GLR71695.1 hypothetical protein GCM10007852_26030 [Agaribacter marinus]
MTTQTLEQQREAFKQRRFLAMPLAGMIVWGAIGVISPFVDEFTKTMMLYFGTGGIFYLGAALSYLTGERFFSKKTEKNVFDGLFFSGLIMALLVFGISIPAAQSDYQTLSLSIGILAGIMWIPFSWIVQHWIGYFHAIGRTLAIVAVWYLFPEHRVEAISCVIVSLYVVSIYLLEYQHRQRTQKQKFQQINLLSEAN